MRANATPANSWLSVDLNPFECCPSVRVSEAPCHLPDPRGSLYIFDAKPRRKLCPWLSDEAFSRWDEVIPHRLLEFLKLAVS